MNVKVWMHASMRLRVQEKVDWPKQIWYYRLSQVSWQGKDK